MAKLSASDISFLTAHGIAVESMFDAEGLPGEHRKRVMKEAGKHFYFGDALCAAAGHQLRTRHGHCIQCDTSKISFATRHSTPACLYVAGSLGGRYTKIGSTENIDDRLVRLRSHAYGCFDDWEILAATPTLASAGLIESKAQKLLMRFQVVRTYMKSGTPQEARELFSCSFPVAAQALGETLPDPSTLQLLCTLQTAKRYEWKHDF